MFKRMKLALVPMLFAGMLASTQGAYAASHDDYIYLGTTLTNPMARQLAFAGFCLGGGIAAYANYGAFSRSKNRVPIVSATLIGVLASLGYCLYASQASFENPDAGGEVAIRIGNNGINGMKLSAFVNGRDEVYPSKALEYNFKLPHGHGPSLYAKARRQISESALTQATVEFGLSLAGGVVVGGFLGAAIGSANPSRLLK